MKNLGIYHQVQFAVLAIFLLMFVTATAMCFIQGDEVSDFIFTTQSSLKDIFLLLLSVKTLQEGIAKANGAEP